MDPALYAATKAAALDVCRQVAALGLPFAEALAKVERELVEAPRDQPLQAMALVLGVVRDCSELGEVLGPVPVAVVAEPAPGAVVALPGGLHG